MDQLHACFAYPLIYNSKTNTWVGLGTWIHGHGHGYFGILGSASSNLHDFKCSTSFEFNINKSLALLQEPSSGILSGDWNHFLYPDLLFMSNGGFNTPTNHRALKIVARVLKLGT